MERLRRAGVRPDAPGRAVRPRPRPARPPAGLPQLDREAEPVVREAPGVVPLGRLGDRVQDVLVEIEERVAGLVAAEPGALVLDAGEAVGEEAEPEEPR